MQTNTIFSFVSDAWHLQKKQSSRYSTAKESNFSIPWQNFGGRTDLVRNVLVHWVSKIHFKEKHVCIHIEFGYVIFSSNIKKHVAMIMIFEGLFGSLRKETAFCVDHCIPLSPNTDTHIKRAFLSWRWIYLSIVSRQLLPSNQFWCQRQLLSDANAT